jgi:hypothetical protein
MSLTKATYSMISGAVANILDFGADPTGVASSSTAIQAAINSSLSVFMPAGTYKISTPIFVPSNVQLWGAGIGATILSIFADVICMRVTGSNVRLGYFSVTVSAATHTTSGIEIGDGTIPAGRCVIDSVGVSNVGLHGFEIRSGNLGNIHNSGTSNCGGSGLNFGIESIDTNSWTMDGYNEFSNNTLDGVHISGNGTANSPRAHQLSGIVSQGNGRYGVYVNSGQNIINAYCEASGTANFYIDTLGKGNQVSTTEGAITNLGTGNLLFNYNIQADYSRQIATDGIKFTGPNYDVTDPTTLDAYIEGTWTPVPVGLTVVGTPTYTGFYTKVGRVVFCTLNIVSTTSTAGTAGSFYFTGLPNVTSVALSGSWSCTAANSNATSSFGNGIVGNGRVYPPTWTATAGVTVSFSYMADN